MAGSELLRRWVSFNAVGMLGVVVQLGVLHVLVRLCGLHYLAATAIAVESAVLHNFAWHQQWTWRDRPAASILDAAGRLGRFHATNGAVSLAGNLALMAILTGHLHIDPLVANLIAIGATSIVNFIASEALVFRTARVSLLVALSLLGPFVQPTTSYAADMMAELTAATVAAWKQYEREVDNRYDKAPATGEPFFATDAFKKLPVWRDQAIAGQVTMVRVESASPGLSEIPIPDGKAHHWIGAVFVPRTSVQRVVTHLRDRAGRESEAYDDVTASKLLSKDGDRVRVFMKIRRDSIITVTYNTEHDVVYRRLGTARASSRSVATKIAELEGAGTPQEKEKVPGRDNGFLWRLNAYWRFEQTPGGVLIECESVSLSRGVPMLLRPFVTGTVERIARESLEKTLISLRKELVAAGPGQ